MYLTKPAGVFLQLMALPFLLWAAVFDLCATPTDLAGAILHGGIGLAALYIGGRPSRRRA